MKKICFILMAIFAVGSIHAAESRLRVAVFDPTTGGAIVDEGTKVAIREIISSTIVNSGRYNIVERSLLEKVMQEQDFSNSGVVDDMQATEVGKLAGANKIVLSVVTVSEGRNIISVKMIDVKTASIDKQKFRVVRNSELLEAVEPLTQELLVEDKVKKEPEKKVLPEPVVPIVKEEKVEEPQMIVPAPEMPGPNEVVFYFAPGYMPENKLHKDNYIEVTLDGKFIGSGTLNSGFYIKIKEKKPRSHVIQFIPTAISDSGKTDDKMGKIIYKINSREQNFYEFTVRPKRKGKWTIYTVLRK